MSKYVCPEIIYKYYSFSGIEKTLSGQSFRLSKTSDFNDPLDMYIGEGYIENHREFLEDFKNTFNNYIFGDLDRNKFIDGEKKDLFLFLNDAIKKSDPEVMMEIKNNFINESLEKIYDVNQIQKTTIETFKLLSQSFEDWGIFCSTINYNNLLMWAHYADMHKGAVIGFKPNVEKDSVFLASKPVKYSEERPLIFGSPQDIIDVGLTISQEDYMAKSSDKLIFTKSLDWSYEQEYRLAVPRAILNGNPFAIFKFYPDELFSIYFGCRMSSENKIYLSRLAKKINNNVLLYEAVRAPREFNLNYKEI